jgi:hypothetical protein
MIVDASEFATDASNCVTIQITPWDYENMNELY